MARQHYVAVNQNRIWEILWKKGWEGPGPQERAEPTPDPWQQAITELVQAAQLKELAVKMPRPEQQTAVLQSANAAIEAFLDDWCGNGWPRWPLPGPRPEVLTIVSQLSLLAHSIQGGALREELLGIASQALARTYDTRVTDGSRTAAPEQLPRSRA